MSEADRHRLLDEIALVTASLEDARAEHGRGELDDEGLAAISSRDRARLAALRTEHAAAGDDVQARSATAGPPPSAARPGAADPAAVSTPAARSGVWLWLGLTSLAAVLVVVATALLVSSTTPSSSAQIGARLSQADALAARGKLAEALPVYGAVLRLDPRQPEALAQSGWLTFEAGEAAHSSQLVAKGEAQVSEAVALAPRAFAGHLYLGVIDLTAHNDSARALDQLTLFLKLKPPARWVRRAKPYIDKAAASQRVAPPSA